MMQVTLDAGRLPAGIAGLALMLAACSEGYPTEDEPLFEPLRMSQVERLLHLNEMGRSRDSEGRWRYELAEGCALMVERKSSWRTTSQVLVPLQEVTTALQHDKAKKLHQVFALPPQSASSMALFSSSDDRDAWRANALIALLKRSCGPGPDSKAD